MDEKEIKQIIGKKIKNKRKELKLTQEQLGLAIGINQRQVAPVEKGRSFPMLSTFVKLAEFFECEITDLFPDEKIDTLDESKIKFIELIKNSSLEQLNKLYSISKIIFE